MTAARHDAAVGLLTSSGNEVTLVVYREQLVDRDSNEPVQQRKSILEVPKAKPLTMDEDPTPATIPEEPAKIPSGPVLRGPMLQVGPKMTPPKTLMTSPTKRAPPPIANKPVLSNKPVTSPNTANARTSFFANNNNTTPVSPGLNANVTDQFNALARQQRNRNSSGQTSPTNNANVRQLNNSSESPSRRLVKQDTPPIEKMSIVKAGGPLGLSIVGGVDHTSHPFGVDNPGIFISKIVPDGAAATTTLRLGDRILSVNAKDLRRATHQEAVMALIAPTFRIDLEIQHDPPPPGLKEISVPRSPGDKLGISIRGGARSHPGNPLDKTDEGVFISKILPHGVVAKDKNLKVGQRILEVNGSSLLGATHEEAVRALRSVNDTLEIMICDGFDPSVLDMHMSTTSLKRSQDSLSSIDRLDDEQAAIQRKEAEARREQQQFELQQEQERLTKLRLRMMREEEIQFADEEDEDGEDDDDAEVIGQGQPTTPGPKGHPVPSPNPQPRKPPPSFAVTSDGPSPVARRPFLGGTPRTYPVAPPKPAMRPPVGGVALPILSQRPGGVLMRAPQVTSSSGT